ncbi:serine hydrolase domain-containing protein [Paenibacillus dendritiformis]|uniref:Beta-lactamase n=1 Tax=Paenibacillus dendritiformis C454 TaxID=1131935 RepID=H3SFU6_9BACL|nr:serine hydrolase [Paenibacillus dendritiformis]EHQ62128.1 beta-lactamase [Paenibacillus dendritiformis C454]CAH8772865.1 beta-lactamase family protein [Paenibacillus dendritiformis]
MKTAAQTGACQPQYDLVKLDTLLHEDHIAWNFRNMDHILPKRDVHAPADKFRFSENLENLADVRYSYNGQASTVGEYMAKVKATAWLVIKDDAIVTERYYNGYTRESTATSMSVAKSFISALMGIAFDEGAMRDVHDPVTRYLPELAGSGYDGATIKDVLQMSSGVRFNEDYADPDAEIYTFMNDVFGESAMPISQYVRKLTRLQPPGHYQYKSVDTQVLCMLLERTTGKKLSAYLEEKLWQPLGMEYDAYWNTDLHGNEIAFAFLNAALRDYAKFGRLVLHQGAWNGRQIISEKWMKESVIPDRSNLQAGQAEDCFGYQYQWWTPLGSDGSEVMARGIYGQQIYINRRHHAVIVKSGVDPAVFNVHDFEAVTAYRTILEHLG